MTELYPFRQFKKALTSRSYVGIHLLKLAHQILPYLTHARELAHLPPFLMACKCGGPIVYGKVIKRD